MDQTHLQAVSWYHATTAAERIASLHAAQRKPLNEGDSERAERRLRQWRAQFTFTTDSYFARHLAMAGINEDEFRRLLGEPIEAVRDRLPIPEWLAEFAQAFSRPAAAHSLSFPEALRGRETVGFLHAVEPLIDQARDRLREGIEPLIQTRSFLPFDPDKIEDALYANLPGQLLMKLGRTLVLELNIARLQGLLKGDTTEERFQRFVERLRQRETSLAIFTEYPVLARQLIVCIDNWVHFSLEFLRRLCADWEAMRATFSPEEDPGFLVALDGGAGDSHRGGRSVMIAKFSSGFRVVYKPRSLAGDIHFQELLAWLNVRGDHSPFHTLKILNRGDHGWVEFVKARGCASPDELRRFYERQGGYLALLYAVAASDFHFENLVAFGEHPVLLDLEALFHPRVRGLGFEHADQLASRTLNDSVLRVGLLPHRTWATKESEGIDFSGLGAAAGQMMPKVTQWGGVGTDEMRLILKPVEMPGGNNRPTLNGNPVDALEYVEAIAAGFTKIYQTLLRRRDELLGENGPLARFAKDEVRAILRSTRTYGLLLAESFHPDVLRDALDRDHSFDRLWANVEQIPELARIIPAEREDLWRNDVPIFTTRPDSRDLWSSSGERIAEFFEEPGLAFVRRRVRQLSDEDLTKQLWFIRASLTALAMGSVGARRASHSHSESQTAPDRMRLLAAARAVGDRLGALALQGEGDATWIGLTLTAKDVWSLAPLGLDLYNGLPGVTLFLAYLGAITGEERYSELSRAALTTIHRQVEQNRSHLTSIGAFDGWGGVIYTLTHLGALWNESELLARAEELVGWLPDLIKQDEGFDVIGGAAGCIGGLICLHSYASSDRALAAAIRCGDRLLVQARSMERGIGWTPKFPAKGPLAGFSHGAAGMAWALMELAALADEDRFRRAALAAIDYERSIFSAEAGNWPDLREFEPSSKTTKNSQAEEKFTTAWCHGAPGIGLARLRSLRHIDDAEIRAEIDVALRTTSELGFGGNHSLCHGDLGNLELLLEAGRILDEPQWLAQAGRMAAMILKSFDKDGWLCGVPLDVESPGLMTGLAGIGYELLRIAEPARVPSVLALDAPTQRL